MPDIEECFHTIVRERGREGGREEAGKKKRQKVLLEKKKKKNTETWGNFLDCRIAAGLSKNPLSSEIGGKEKKEIALAL